MTRRASRPSRRVPRIWLLPALILTAILGLTAADVFSRSLVLDLVAWWPVWLALIIVVALFGGRRIGRLRLSGLASILVAAVLVTFAVGHLGGWSLNPSSTRHLVGPEVAEFTKAELAADMSGELRLSGGSPFLYEIDPLRRGGGVGIPSAVERSTPNSISISLEAPSDPGFDTSAGWDVTLSNQPTWTLILAGDLELDLSDLMLDQLEVIGSGLVRLGEAGDTVLVGVEGAFAIEIPVASPCRVIGDAQVPEGWVETSDGWRSPNEGLGWVIDVSPGSVVSIDQG